MPSNPDISVAAPASSSEKLGVPYVIGSLGEGTPFYDTDEVSFGYPEPTDITPFLRSEHKIIDLVSTYESLARGLTKDAIVFCEPTPKSLEEIFPDVYDASKGLLSESRRKMLVDRSGIEAPIPERQIDLLIKTEEAKKVHQPLTPAEAKHLIRRGRMVMELHNFYGVDFFKPELTASVPDVGGWDLQRLASLVGEEHVEEALAWLKSISTMVVGRAKYDLWGNDDRNKRVPWRNGMENIYGSEIFNEAYFNNNQLSGNIKDRLSRALFYLGKLITPDNPNKYFISTLIQKTNSDLARAYKQEHKTDATGNPLPLTDSQKIFIVRLWEFVGLDILQRLAGDKTPSIHPYLT